MLVPIGKRPLIVWSVHINVLFSFSVVASLQTGMRGAYGKPYGTVARVNIGQIIFSIRCKDANQATIVEALRRAKYKFAGRQKVIISKKWGFTKLNRGDYEQARDAGKLVMDGSHVKYLNGHGSLSEYFKSQANALLA